MVAVLAMTGCAGSGTWAVETWGEEYIEEAIPAADVADGYEIVFDQFLVSLGDVTLVDGNGEAAAAIDGQQIFDLTQVGPHPVGDADATATHYDRVDMVIAPAIAAAAGNVGEDDLARMNNAGLSVAAQGTASLGADSFTFAWDFDTETHYVCEPDLTLPEGGEGSTQLTIHGDHLFYDDLYDPDAAVTFTEIAAADADGDGDVTRTELEAVDVAQTGYGVGPYSEVTDLWAFVEHLTRTLGHIDGEGHCQVDF
jgi:hypothetical protein